MSSSFFESTDQILGSLYGVGRYHEVIERTSHLIIRNPENAFFWKILGAACAKLKKTTTALDAVRRSLAITPSDGETIWNYACLLDELGCCDSAVHYYRCYVCIDPDQLGGYEALAVCVYGLKQYEMSVSWANRAVGISPRHIRSRLTKGSAQRKLEQVDEAEAEFSKAMSLDPYCHDTLFNLGSIMLERGQLTAAIRMLEAAIAVDPSVSGGYLNAGNAARKASDIARVTSRYRRARIINPEHDFLLGTCIQLSLNGCDWRYLDDDIRHLRQLISDDKRAAASLTVLAATDDPDLQLRAAKIYVQSLRLPVTEDCISLPSLSKRIRIGYFSADFRNHPTSHLIAGLLESHDRNKFEVFAFSLRASQHDWMTERIKRAVDHFTDVTNLDDVEVVSRCRNAGLDIAIDLMGFTEHCRPAIFAQRCAPIQINYLGFIGSMGAPFIDYLVADKCVIDGENRHAITEAVIYMPECFQVNEGQRQICSKKITRDVLGLPSKAVVFCCFNSAYKINPKMLSIWVEILTRVPKSVLWLVAPDRGTEDRLCTEAASRGLSSLRLIFSRRVSYGEYLARFSLADLFLDTFPYNGGATSSDALWAGLPVLTLTGRSFVSRMGKSLLTAINLPELIAENPHEYVNLAVSFGLEKERLTRLRDRLTDPERRSSLFDVSRFAKHFEVGLSEVHARNVRGQPASDYVIPVEAR